MNGWLILLIVLAVVGGVAWLIARKSKAGGSGSGGEALQGEFERLGISPGRANFNPAYAATSPSGVRVRSVAQVSSAALMELDAAVEQIRRRYGRKYPRWTKALSAPEYSVLFIEPDGQIDEGTPLGAPTITVGGIESAGTVIANSRGGSPLVHIVLPHQGPAWQWLGYLHDSMYNEGEHFCQSQNDEAVFRSHLGTADVHPHVGPEWEPDQNMRAFLLRPRVPAVPVTMGCGMDPVTGGVDQEVEYAE